MASYSYCQRPHELAAWVSAPLEPQVGASTLLWRRFIHSHAISDAQEMLK